MQLNAHKKSPRQRKKKVYFTANTSTAAADVSYSREPFIQSPDTTAAEPKHGHVVFPILIHRGRSCVFLHLFSIDAFIGCVIPNYYWV